MISSDSLRSYVSGLGDPFRDKSASLFYEEQFLSDPQLQAAYRSSWLPRKIIDIPALDALRKWRSWQADQKQITLIEKEEKRLGLQLKLLQCKTLARLWGGAAIYIGTKNGKGREMEPFDPEEVTKGGLEYLTVMSRRELTHNGLDEDPVSEFYGMPPMYQVSNGRTFLDIHPSRLVVMVGAPLPDPWTAVGVHQGWGDSILQHTYTAIQNADATAANIASLVFEANVDVFAIPDLMEHMSSKQYRDKLLERFTLAAAGKSITKALLRDTEEEYDRKQISFAALPDVIQQFLIITSGASDIPLTRLLGQSPSGLSSTGEHDMKNYYDRVTSIQTLEIQPATHRLDEALLRSSLGARPEEVFYEWRPLEEMSEKEEAEIADLNAKANNVYITSGLFSQEEMREVVGNQLVESGHFPGLGDLLQENGMDLPEFDLGLREKEATVKQLENPPKPTPGQTGDAAPRSLYVRRDVINKGEITEWFSAQGVSDIKDDLHVTIIYSKAAVDWMKMGQAWESRMEVPEGGPRLMDKFGPLGDSLVLLFKSSELDWRHAQAKELGASTDYEEYQSHITISRTDAPADGIKPWQGAILLGPEVFEEVKDD